MSMNIRESVATCLYSGIYDRIESVKKHIPHMDFEYIENSYNELREAVDFYNEHCVVSGKYLTEALEKLKIMYYNYASNKQ